MREMIDSLRRRHAIANLCGFVHTQNKGICAYKRIYTHIYATQSVYAVSNVCGFVHTLL